MNDYSLKNRSRSDASTKGSTMKISVVIPAHNEMYSIARVVRSCRDFCDEVIVVDDGSPDDTSRVSREAGATVIRNRKNLGVVKSTGIGLRAAMGDIIVTLDADGEHEPGEIPKIVEPIRSGIADLVLGRREGCIPFSERLIARLVNFRVKCHDVGSGYRAFRADLARMIQLSGVCLCGSLVLEAHKRGARIVEVPIQNKPRSFGKGHWASPFSRARIHLMQVILLSSRLISWSARLAYWGVEGPERKVAMSRASRSRNDSEARRNIA
jgi:glycosyltransferase involved in cell wall biosynthesis